MTITHLIMKSEGVSFGKAQGKSWDLIKALRLEPCDLPNNENNDVSEKQLQNELGNKDKSDDNKTQQNKHDENTTGQTSVKQI